LMSEVVNLQLGNLDFDAVSAISSVESD